MPLQSSCPGAKASWLDESKHPVFCLGAMPIPCLVLPLCICFALIFVKTWQQADPIPRRRYDEKRQHEIRHAQQNDSPPSLTTEIARTLASMVPFWTSLVATCYISSCIGWRFVLTTRLAQPPSIQGGVPAGMLFAGVWIAMDWCYRRLDRELALMMRPFETFVREVKFDVEVVAWVISAEMVIWSLLKGKLMF